MKLNHLNPGISTLPDKETFQSSFKTQMLKIIKNDEQGWGSVQLKYTQDSNILSTLTVLIYSAHFSQPGFWERRELWTDSIQLSGLCALALLKHPS